MRKLLPDPKDFESDWDYYDALEEYKERFERDDYEEEE